MANLTRLTSSRRTLPCPFHSVEHAVQQPKCQQYLYLQGEFDCANTHSSCPHGLMCPSTW
jgi:hypothetical protein